MSETMTIDVEHLPDDVATLKKLVSEAVVALAKRDAAMEKQAREIEFLKYRLEQAFKKIFGATSEKLNKQQLQLLFEQLPEALKQAVEEKILEDDEEDLLQVEVPAHRRRARGLRTLPENLPVETVVHDVPEEKRACPACGTAREKIGEDKSRQLEYVPSCFKIIEHIRIKYACRPCEGEVVAGPVAPGPIDKGLPGPGLMAHVLVSKFADSLPLARLEGIYARQGVELARSTMASWVRDAADLLSPIWKEMTREVLAGRKIHADDTPVRVRDPDYHQRCRTGRVWVYVGGKEDDHVVFDYTPDHAQKGPMAFLSGFKGCIQGDAYDGWDAVSQANGGTTAGCWAHCRRYFYDAEKDLPGKAGGMLALIGKLYRIEKRVKAAATREEKLQIRQQQSQRVLKVIRAWLDEERSPALPESNLRKAITYATNQWEPLTRYASNPDLDIDNSAAERALRMVAIGRKNWMHFGSDAGGERAAVIFSFIGTCKAHKIDPFAYLRDVLSRVRTHDPAKIAELTPKAWLAARQTVPAESLGNGNAAVTAPATPSV